MTTDNSLFFIGASSLKDAIHGNCRLTTDVLTALPVELNQQTRVSSIRPSMQFVRVPLILAVQSRNLDLFVFIYALAQNNMPAALWCQSQLAAAGGSPPP
jgi:hypothetical protein